MGGFFGVASKDDCVFDLFFGVDYKIRRRHPFNTNLFFLI